MKKRQIGAFAAPIVLAFALFGCEPSGIIKVKQDASSATSSSDSLRRNYWMPAPSATPISGTNYYISPVGNDTSGAGSVVSPWKTLSKACSAVTSVNSTILVLAGDYTETQVCNLSIGVSIEGVGVSSHIISTHVATSFLDGAINLKSQTEGVSGNQSISKIKLDGNNLAADNAIIVHGRSNVKIHDLTIVDFYANAIQFNGRVGTWGTEPSVYATGNEIYNATISNCSSRQANEPLKALSIGMIAISGQQGLLIHDNILTQTSRPIGENGDILEAIEGNNKGLKYYNNKSYKPDTEGAGSPVNDSALWNFHIEHWNSTGGMEIYNNEFIGGVAIDVSGNSNTKGAYPFSWSIHDNLIALRAQLPIFQSRNMMGICFEGTVEDAVVNGNHFRNNAGGILMSLQFNTTHQQNIKIQHNVFENIGYANGDISFAISTHVVGAAMVLQDIFIDNNTVSTSSSAGKTNGALMLNGAGTNRRIYFRNNIVTNIANFGYIAFWNGTGLIENVYSQNNVLYSNANNNSASYFGGKTVSNFVSQNNVFSNPLFNSPTDFSLQPSSPAVNFGIYLGLPYLGAAPDAGAIEYGAPSI